MERMRRMHAIVERLAQEEGDSSRDRSPDDEWPADEVLEYVNWLMCSEFTSSLVQPERARVEGMLLTVANNAFLLKQDRRKAKSHPAPAPRTDIEDNVFHGPANMRIVVRDPATLEPITTLTTDVSGQARHRGHHVYELTEPDGTVVDVIRT
jgi:hypothetical protein